MPTIYLDMDGVLADFDAGARIILETDNTYRWEFIHGQVAFWSKLNSHANFFGALPMMPDAHKLVEAVERGGFTPVVLTALPRKNAFDVKTQKERWIEKHFGLKVITCMTDDKPDFCEPQDVLVDDRAINRDGWEKKGGTFVLHTSAERSIFALKAKGYL